MQVLPEVISSRSAYPPASTLLPRRLPAKRPARPPARHAGWLRARIKTISVGRSMSLESVCGGHAIPGIGVGLERYKISQLRKLLILQSKRAISWALRYKSS